MSASASIDRGETIGHIVSLINEQSYMPSNVPPLLGTVVKKSLVARKGGGYDTYEGAWTTPDGEILDVAIKCVGRTDRDPGMELIQRVSRWTPAESDAIRINVLIWLLIAYRTGDLRVTESPASKHPTILRVPSRRRIRCSRFPFLSQWQYRATPRGKSHVNQDRKASIREDIPSINFRGGTLNILRPAV